MKPRHVPIRTCAGCRQERAKRDMVRIVRGPDGSVGADPTGKRPGRGTYLCPRFECWTKAFRNGSLARALKAHIQEADLSRLRTAAEEFQDRDIRAPTSPGPGATGA
jgi:predicted RNA-binding protein YlxR (DUF448 family)